MNYPAAELRGIDKSQVLVTDSSDRATYQTVHGSVLCNNENMNMKLIIGLGNPGEKYEGTRHNLGFMVLDEYAKKQLGPNISWQEEKKFKSEILKLNDNLWLVKPLTFMNNSGMAISRLVDYFKIPLDGLIIIHDELDLPLGKIKVRLGGASSGHHGVESIISALNNDKFIRLRLGIGNVRALGGEHKRVSFSAEDFVLDPFASNERSKKKHMLKQAIKGLEVLLEKGLGKAQNQFN